MAQQIVNKIVATCRQNGKPLLVSSLCIYGNTIALPLYVIYLVCGLNSFKIIMKR